MNAQPKQKPQAEPQKSGSKRETEAFVATLRHLDRDGVLAEANAAVEAAVMAAKTTGGRAEVTVKLTIQRRGNNQMIVAGDVTKKLPRQKPLPVTLFAGDNGTLLVSDPDQQEFAEIVSIADNQPARVEKID